MADQGKESGQPRPDGEVCLICVMQANVFRPVDHVHHWNATPRTTVNG